MPDFRPVSSRTVWVGKTMQMVEMHIEIDGKDYMREVVNHVGSVAVVPFTGSEVVLLRQYRPAVGAWLYEIPAGKRDVADEDPETTAARECEEETGYRPGRLTLLHRFYNSPGYTDEETLLYLAEDLEPVLRAPEGPEEMHAEVVAMRLGEIESMLARGEFSDAKTILGLYSVLQRLA